MTITASVAELKNYVEEDSVGCFIANKYVNWFNLRVQRQAAWQELRQYLFATDTTQTSNRKLEWKHTTTIPKLTQIRDNLYANYMASSFPKRKNFDWLANRKDDASLAKRQSILGFAKWMTSQPQWKFEMSKCDMDYIDYGNSFGLLEWIDQRVERPDQIQTGYVGPMLRRISPLDIVFNPTAPSFYESPKIIRSLISLGDLKKMMNTMSQTDQSQDYKELFDYLMNYRDRIFKSGTDLSVQDSYYQMDGFSSFREYLEGDFVEVLTFYGDMFDKERNELLENHVIMVVDRHKVISKKPNPSYYGYAPIFHVGWRVRQDNLWAMGPLENLVGMQYKLDHFENLKSDVLDLIAFPVLKIKGYVNDFEWGPMQRIVTDAEGDVEMLIPPFQILQFNHEIQYILSLMEEMAGAPKEAMGFRTPGEKTAFEVQRLENAASRIFQNKTTQFQEHFEERVMNAGLEMMRRNMTGPQEISIFDDEMDMQEFMTLTPTDLTGSGSLKCIAARHFAEKSEIVQNIQNLYSSGIAQDPLVSAHISGYQTAKTLEEALDLTDYGLVRKFVRLGEQAEGQRLNAAHEEQTQMQIGTPSGLTPEDQSGPDLIQRK